MERLIVFYRAVLPTYQFLCWKEQRCGSLSWCQPISHEHVQFLGKKQNVLRKVHRNQGFGYCSSFLGLKN